MTISAHTLRRLCGAAALATCVVTLGVPAALAGGAHALSAGTGSVSGFGPSERWYLDAPVQAHSPIATLFGPSERWYLDASAQAHSPVVTVVKPAGFQWGDFGFGVAAACALMLLVGLSIRLLATRRGRKQPGPVATV